MAFWSAVGMAAHPEGQVLDCVRFSSWGTGRDVR
jgi:hypothetical protein